MAEPNPTPTPNEPTPAPQGTPQGNAPAFDYDKLASLITGKQSVDIATVPYVLKIADFSKAVTDGKVNAEKLTEAVKKVLDDIPALKGKPAENGTGVKKIGGDGNSDKNLTEDALRGIFGIKSKK